MNVLLVANYAYDAQTSMARFVAMLQEGLSAEGVEVAVVRPEPLLGNLHPGAHGLGKWLGYFDKFVLFPPKLRRLARAADVVHVCDHSNAMYLAHPTGRPHLLTCHDLLAVRSALGEFPQNRTGWTGRVLQRWILSSLRGARRVTCVSEATRRDVLRLAGLPPGKVSVTPMAGEAKFAPVEEIARAAEARRVGDVFDAEVFARHGLPAGPYLLHVGGAQWYKNRDAVVAMHGALRARLGDNVPKLVMVGPECCGEGIECRQGVSDAALAALYSGAELLFFPSLAEGFGWPILEAQACGCRVVTTGQAPMTEVGGEAARYLLDPGDVESGAELVAQVLAQEMRARREMVAAGLANAARFFRARMVAEYMALYREVAGQ